MADPGDSNTVPGTKGVPGVKVQDAVVESIRQEIHYHTGPGREWCLSCNREVLKGERAYRCPWCGNSPFHEQCRDEELECCPVCARGFRIEEEQRAACLPLLLTIQRKMPANGDLPSKVFLFARRTVQIGRAKAHQVPPTAAGTEPTSYKPRFNDIISRVITSPDGSRKIVDDDRSLMISRCHGAFRIYPSPEGEELRYVDCGNDGQGSSFGSWVASKQLSPGRWHAVEPGAELQIGCDPARRQNGLGLCARICRSPEDAKNIAAVRIHRSDTLAGDHSYVVVSREASIGAGGYVCIPIVPGDPRLFGMISYRSGGLFFVPVPGCGLVANSDLDETGSVPLKPGSAFQGEDVSILVRQVVDQDFYTP